MRTPEGWEKKDIDDYFDRLIKEGKPMWYFAPYMAGYGKSGVSDRVGCYDSTFFCVEVKRPSKEPTPIQWKRMREIEAAGGKAFWGTAEKVIAEFEAWIS